VKGNFMTGLYRVLQYAVTAFAAIPAMAGWANAEDYPSRPITIIVGFSPGGPTDILARILADRMKTSLGQPVIVENMAGAGGTLAGGRVARAKPDGYTLNIGNWSSSVGGGALYPLHYHVMDDFEPVARLTTSYVWIVGRKGLPAANLKDLVAWLKANPGKATAGSIGIGSAAQMCIIDFQNKTDTKFLIVPYPGGVAAVQDLLAGRIDFACPEATQTLPYLQTGNIEALGVAARQRWFAAPEVPTIEEGGVPEVDIAFWNGLWAPKGTPKNVIAKLNDAVVVAFADPAIQKRFAELGHLVPRPDQLTPEALAAFHKAELDKWWPIMRAAGIRIN
jgi:tripartite-type tricarboxylate transporter receptor subunit TctC